MSGIFRLTLKYRGGGSVILHWMLMKTMIMPNVLKKTKVIKVALRKFKTFQLYFRLTQIAKFTFFRPNFQKCYIILLLETDKHNTKEISSSCKKNTAI